MEKFIIKEYYTHNQTNPFQEENYLEEINSLYKEDIAVFDSSFIFVARKNSKIIGSVKVTLWDEKTQLPIEKLFGVQVKKICNRHRKIWHVGRFAISKSNGLLLLKRLLILAISQICTDPNSLMIAECDTKLVKGLNLMGIKTEALAPSIFYLGSETLPIFSTFEWLNNFLIHTQSQPVESK